MPTPNPQASDLLARYLQAIGEHLPASTREDVLAELRANLSAQLDDRAEELNRPLTDADITPILQQHGRPIVVAARYLPQQYLIGPAIFPYYLMILRKATPFVLLACFIAQCSSLIFVHTLPELIRGIALSLGQLIPDLLIFAASATIAFAIAEFVYNRNHGKPFGASWDPTKLAALTPQPKGKSRAARIADLVFHCLWFLYVLEIPAHPFLILGPSDMYLHLLSARLAPVWHTFYIALLVVLVVQLAAKMLALNPRFESWRIPLDILTKLAGLAIVLILVYSKIYFVAVNPAAAHATLDQVNYAVNIGFRIILALGIFGLVMDAWKHYGPNLRIHRLAL